MSKILVIAGGDWQIDLIKKAKQMGHFVICSNLYDDSPAFPFADVCEVADVLDKEKNLQIAKKYLPDAIISDQSDIAVPTVAFLNEKMGLRGIGMELANLFTDKSLQRAFCKRHKIPVPDFRVCKSAEDAVILLEQYGKIIIKPIDSQSSRGVFTITSEQMLKENVEETLSFSNRKKEFLAEEYIEGDEFTVDGLVVNGHHYPLCISIKEMYPNNENISRKQSYSYHSPLYNYDVLRSANRMLFEKAGLTMGLTHSEYKFNGEQFFLIEAGARGGGSNLSSKVVPFMSGIDNYDYLIKEALGQDVDESALMKHVFSEDKYSVMRFFDFGEGVVKHVAGIEFLRNHPLLLDYQMNVRPGDRLNRPKYGRLRPGHFIIGGDNKEYVEQEANKIVEMVSVDFS